MVIELFDLFFLNTDSDNFFCAFECKIFGEFIRSFQFFRVSNFDRYLGNMNYFYVTFVEFMDDIFLRSAMFESECHNKGGDGKEEPSSLPRKKYQRMPGKTSAQRERERQLLEQGQITHQRTQTTFSGPSKPNEMIDLASSSLNRNNTNNNNNTTTTTTTTTSMVEETTKQLKNKDNITLKSKEILINKDKIEKKNLGKISRSYSSEMLKTVKLLEEIHKLQLVTVDPTNPEDPYFKLLKKAFNIAVANQEGDTQRGAQSKQELLKSVSRTKKHLINKEEVKFKKSASPSLRLIDKNLSSPAEAKDALNYLDSYFKVRNLSSKLPERPNGIYKLSEIPKLLKEKSEPVIGGVSLSVNVPAVPGVELNIPISTPPSKGSVLISNLKFSPLSKLSNVSNVSNVSNITTTSELKPVNITTTKLVTPILDDNSKKSSSSNYQYTPTQGPWAYYDRYEEDDKPNLFPPLSGKSMLVADSLVEYHIGLRYLLKLPARAWRTELISSPPYIEGPNSTFSKVSSASLPEAAKLKLDAAVVKPEAAKPKLDAAVVKPEAAKPMDAAAKKAAYQKECMRKMALALLSSDSDDEETYTWTPVGQKPAIPLVMTSTSSSTMTTTVSTSAPVKVSSPVTTSSSTMTTTVSSARSKFDNAVSSAIPKVMAVNKPSENDNIVYLAPHRVKNASPVVSSTVNTKRENVVSSTDRSSNIFYTPSSGDKDSSPLSHVFEPYRARPGDNPEKVRSMKEITNKQAIEAFRIVMAVNPEIAAIVKRNNPGFDPLHPKLYEINDLRREMGIEVGSSDEDEDEWEIIPEPEIVSEKSKAPAKSAGKSTSIKKEVPIDNLEKKKSVSVNSDSLASGVKPKGINYLRAAAGLEPLPSAEPKLIVKASSKAAIPKNIVKTTAPLSEPVRQGEVAFDLYAQLGVDRKAIIQKAVSEGKTSKEYHEDLENALRKAQEERGIKIDLVKWVEDFKKDQQSIKNVSEQPVVKPLQSTIIQTSTGPRMVYIQDIPPSSTDVVVKKSKKPRFTEARIFAQVKDVLDFPESFKDNFKVSLKEFRIRNAEKRAIRELQHIEFAEILKERRRPAPTVNETCADLGIDQDALRAEYKNNDLLYRPALKKAIEEAKLKRLRYLDDLAVAEEFSFFTKLYPRSMPKDELRQFWRVQWERRKSFSLFDAEEYPKLLKKSKRTITGEWFVKPRLAVTQNRDWIDSGQFKRYQGTAYTTKLKKLKRFGFVRELFPERPLRELDPRLYDVEGFYASSKLRSKLLVLYNPVTNPLIMVNDQAGACGRPTFLNLPKDFYMLNPSGSEISNNEITDPFVFEELDVISNKDFTSSYNLSQHDIDALVDIIHVQDDYNEAVIDWIAFDRIERKKAFDKTGKVWTTPKQWLIKAPILQKIWDNKEQNKFHYELRGSEIKSIDSLTLAQKEFFRHARGKYFDNRWISYAFERYRFHDELERQQIIREETKEIDYNISDPRKIIGCTILLAGILVLAPMLLKMMQEPHKEKMLLVDEIMRRKKGISRLEAVEIADVIEAKRSFIQTRISNREYKLKGKLPFYRDNGVFPEDLAEIEEIYPRWDRKKPTYWKYGLIVKDIKKTDNHIIRLEEEKIAIRENLMTKNYNPTRKNPVLFEESPFYESGTYFMNYLDKWWR